MQKIDIHTHILPEKIPNWFQKFGYGDFIHLEHHKPCCAKMIKGDKVFREIEENCWSTEVREKEMDTTEVDIQVLSTVPVLFNYWAKPEHGLETSRFFNDHIAACIAEKPKRFMGLGTLPLQDIDKSIKEMERICKELKLPGIEIGSNINGTNLSDEKFFPIWEAAQEYGCSIFIHPWEMMAENEMQKYWLPWLVGMPAETSRAICSLIFGGVFSKYPNVKFCFAHGGGSFPATVGRVEHGWKVRPDLCAIDEKNNPRNFLGKFWVDSLVHDHDSLDLLLKTIGINKICCGSDYPFPLGEHVPGELIQNHILTPQEKNAMLYSNAIDWLS